MSENVKKIRIWNRRVNPLWAFVIVFVIFTLLFFPGGLPILQAFWALVTGWVSHGFRVMPAFAAKWQSTILPVAAVLLAWWVGHRWLRGFLKAKGSSLLEKWTIRHSGALLALLMLGSAAAVSISGVVHQAMWLGQTQWTEIRGARPLTIARLEMRNLMQMMHYFNNENGRLPKNLDELRMSEVNRDYHFVERTFFRSHGLVLSPMMTQPGAVLENLNPATVILISDLVEGHHVIVRADGSQDAISVEELEELIARKDWQHPPSK